MASDRPWAMIAPVEMIDLHQAGIDHLADDQAHLGDAHGPGNGHHAGAVGVVGHGPQDLKASPSSRPPKAVLDIRCSRSAKPRVCCGIQRFQRLQAVVAAVVQSSGHGPKLPGAESYTATDAGGSGVTAPAAYVFSDGADQSLAAVTVFDVAGNESNAAGGYTGIDQDTVAPVLSAVISSPDAVTGWYNIQSGAATVTYTATDAGGSGVTAPAAYVFSDGADQSLAAVTVFDVAGNESNAAGAFDGIDQDTVAPVLSAVISSPAWHGLVQHSSGAATVTYTATDAGGSGVTAPAAYVFGDGADQSLAAVTVFDVAGNESNAAGGYTGINQDTVAPVLSAVISSPDAVTHWYNIASGPATVTYTASDAGGSGVTAPAAYVFGDGADQSLAAVTVFDVAGNESNAAGGYTGIDQDTVAPVLSAVISSPDAVTGWYNIASGAATVTYTATDAGGSGVAPRRPTSLATGPISRWRRSRSSTWRATSPTRRGLLTASTRTRWPRSSRRSLAAPTP